MLLLTIHTESTLRTAARRTIVVDTNERRVNTESIEALATLGCLYKRNGQLVERIDFGGILGVRVVPYARLRHLLSQAVEYVQHFTSVRTGAETKRGVHVPGWCARAVRARGEWPGIPPFPSTSERACR